MTICSTFRENVEAVAIKESLPLAYASCITTQILCLGEFWVSKYVCRRVSEWVDAGLINTHKPHKYDTYKYKSTMKQHYKWKNQVFDVGIYLALLNQSSIPWNNILGS